MELAKREGVHANMQKNEIEMFLKNKGDYVKIDHLTRLIATESLSLDLKKFVSNILAEIYEKKGMYLDAAKMNYNAGLQSATPQEKSKYFKKEAICYVQAGVLERLDSAIERAVSEVREIEKMSVYNELLCVCKKLADEYLKKNRIASAMKIYEKILNMKISPEQQKEIQNKLISIYEKLGKVNAYLSMKNIRDKKPIPTIKENPVKKDYFSELGI